MKTPKSLQWFSLLLMALLLAGCDGQPGSETSKPAAPPSDEALTILARADAVDSAEDHVVGKCLTCSLGMDGNATYAAHFGPYELHLCSKACKKQFDADPEKAVIEVKLPTTPE